MSETGVENFFEGAVRTGAPSVSLRQPGDFVHGEIVEQFMTEAKKFGSDEVEVDRKTGQPIKQLVVILQTDLRNWDKVAKVPTTEAGVEKPGSEDDGKRAVYIKPWTNIHGAVGKAVAKATGKPGPLRDGGTLGVKIAKLENTGKGNPLKVHEAVYTAPAESNGFFGGSESAPLPVGSSFGGGDQANAPAARPSQQNEEPPF